MWDGGKGAVVGTAGVMERGRVGGQGTGTGSEGSGAGQYLGLG